MLRDNINSELLGYIVDQELKAGDRLPSLTKLGIELGVSVGKLREQLELARQLGFVSVRPRLGTHREPFDFHRAIHTSVMFGLATCEASFEQLSQLRQIIEASMWSQAVSELRNDDKLYLKELIAEAWEILHGTPVHIPNNVHRQLHLKIFERLDNPFVLGLLQSYWDAYEATELTRFADYQYWLDVWTYHERIVEAICTGAYAQGKLLLVEHFQLLPTVTLPATFER
jgi:DNA-binding FadR family transcriptional regulator